VAESQGLVEMPPRCLQAPFATFLFLLDLSREKRLDEG
jgi:hypothetical protein